MTRDDTQTTGRVLLLLGVLLPIVFLLLLAVDRVIRSGEKRQTVMDAVASAGLIGEEINAARDYLGTVADLSEGRDDTTIGDSAMNRQGMHGLVKRLWILDSSGFREVDRSKPADASLDSAVYGMATQPQGDRRSAGGIRLVVIVGAQGNRESDVAVAARSRTGSGRIRRTVVGLLDERVLLENAVSLIGDKSARIGLLIDGDTVGWTPRVAERSPAVIRTQTRVPGTVNAAVVSGTAQGISWSRWGIWLIGAIPLGLLVVGVVRERRQINRAAQRSLELERLSTELLRASRMKSEFLASVSHELRTPLNAIVGFSELLREGAYGELSDKQISPVERIGISAARLQTQVNQILDIAKITAGRVETQLETVALEGFLASVVSEIEPLIREKGLEISVTVRPERMKLRTDASHLRQILTNLLGNAVKYTRVGRIELFAHVEAQGPEVDSIAVTGQHPIFRLQLNQTWLAIDVKDTGIGVADADRERIFEEFERGNAGGTEIENWDGTGLGLPISRRLAALLGGMVTLETEVARGSVFTVWLPVRT